MTLFAHALNPVFEERCSLNDELEVRVCVLTVFIKTKLEAELQLIEEKHQSKKRKFAEGSEQFHDEYMKVIDLNG
ncbi:hypothetical protein DPMN_194202 [Dreissena polymorpha]|uniref:Uncharacterized protein n=1 Tax=Dreissena polymorpha TaxID=45954 RepID=A0A9D4BDS5_DREPO|nr:hypothetical protein DPMN_194202 [Dreissena polymorpha]